MRAVLGLLGYDSEGYSPRERVLYAEESQKDLETVLNSFQSLAEKEGFLFFAVFLPQHIHLYLSKEEWKTHSFNRYARNRVRRIVGLDEIQAPYLCRRLFPFLEKEGIEYLDLFQIFHAERMNGNPIEELYWVKQDFHCTPLGYHLMAKGVSEHLLHHPFLAP